MSEVIVKTVFDFDEEIDVSYVKFLGDSKDYLYEIIKEANESCQKYIVDINECIYANEGRCATTLCNYLEQNYNTEYQVIFDFTVKDEEDIVVEPDYDLEVRLW